MSVREEFRRSHISSLIGKRLERIRTQFQPNTCVSPYSSYIQPGGRQGFFKVTREEQESGHLPPSQGMGPTNIAGLKSLSQRRGDNDMSESENVFMREQSRFFSRLMNFKVIGHLSSLVRSLHLTLYVPGVG